MVDHEILWDKFENYVIRDVQRRRRNEIIELMLEKYFKTNRIFKQLGYLDDEFIFKVYRKYVRHILDGECSIIVEDLQTHEIKAVALLSCMMQNWHSWTALALAVDDSKFTNICDLKFNLFNDYGLEHWQDDFDTLHVFEYYIDDELHFEPKFMKKFFNTISEVARHMKMPRVTYVSLNETEEEDAIEAGYEPLVNAIYSIYLVGGKRPFVTLRDIDEMQAVLFELKVTELTPYYDMKIRGIDIFDNEGNDDSRIVSQFLLTAETSDISL